MKKISKAIVLSCVLSLTACSNLWFEGKGSSADTAASSRNFALPRPAFEMTPEVQSELVQFTRRDRAFIEGSLDRMYADHAAVYSVFNKQGLPSELISVAMVESRFVFDARSRAGAVGLWQLMPATARSFGLRVDSFHDERKDPVKATYAASGLLRELYTQFGDWELALAAYNAGPATIRRAIARTGSRHFWTLARRGLVRNETRRFVAKVVAASIIGKSPKTYGFNAVAIG